MDNPWLAIPLDDYEGHMGSAAIEQLDALAELFERALLRTRPESVAILGVAGGSGLDRISPDMTHRVCGVDINPDYLEAVRRRYGNLPGLELHCADLANQALHLAPVCLVHAALIFEHAGLDGCLRNALSMVAEGGSLSVVLQLPSPQTPGVSASPYASIQTLSGDFQLIDPAQFRETFSANGFRQTWETRHPLPGGKAFWMGIFSRTLQICHDVEELQG
jgi:SAM-dependent methyltransferase